MHMNMNFSLVKEKVQRARIQAAAAAQKLSLNEMAKQDEYIHSQGLNVGNGNGNGSGKSTGTSSSKVKSVNDHILEEVDASNSILQNVGSGDSTHSLGERNSISVQNTSHDVMTIQDDHVHDHDDDSVDSLDSLDEDHDPILQMLKSERTSHHQNQFSPPIISTGADVVADADAHVQMNTNPYTNGILKRTDAKDKKDPNRFMADLDARLVATPRTNTPPAGESNHDTNAIMKNSSSKLNLSDDNTIPPISSSSSSTTTPQQKEGGDNLLQSFTNSGNKMSWLKNVASPKLQQSFNNVMKQVPGNMGFNTNYDKVNQDENNDVEMTKPKKKIIRSAEGENIEVLSSSSLALGDAENAELERLKQLMNKSNNSYISVVLNLIEKNRYYLFIVLTFILTTLGYFYTRNKTDDSVQ
jgi:hypothetical protein